MHCMYVHRENAQIRSHIGPFNTEIWIEYICIMDFHTLQCLVWILYDVIDGWSCAIGWRIWINVISWKQIHLSHQRGVGDVMSFIGVAVKQFLPPTSFRKYCNHVIKIVKKQSSQVKLTKIVGVLRVFCFICRMCQDGSSALNSNIPVVRKTEAYFFFFESSCNPKIHPYPF